MKQPDSPKAPTRRALLRSGLGAGALLAHPVAAFAAAPPGFDQWRDGFRARALAKGISEATWTRVMGHIEPDMSVFKQMQQPAGIQRGDLAIHQSPRLGLAHHRRQGSAAEERGAVCADRTGFRRRARHAAGAVGRRIRLRRSAGAAEPHAPGISLAGGAGLERAAPPRLLGNRTDQCAEDRRSRLEHAGGDAGIVGRRDGTYPVDAGSLAQCRDGL